MNVLGAIFITILISIPKTHSYQNFLFHSKLKVNSLLHSTEISKNIQPETSKSPIPSLIPNKKKNENEKLVLSDSSSEEERGIKLGLKGNWYEKSGNFLLKPPKEWIRGSNKPLGVIHFIGGAFVGAAPHLSYKYLLESLADSGYIIVATPYRLNMDYVKICDDILAKFDGVAYDLASEYGALPVIGMGHSCGALLQTLITSLFPDTPRALNILISYNNKPIYKVIPAFQELIVPLSQQLLTSQNPRIQNLRNIIQTARSTFNEFLKSIRDFKRTPLFVRQELLPLFEESVEVADQLVPLLTSIAEGTKTETAQATIEFTPSPLEAKETCRRMYRARKTLLIKFNNDALDESTDIEKVLREANTIMRMKRPMVEMEVELKILDGTHITPLTQNIIDPPDIILKNDRIMRLEPDPLKNFRETQREEFLKSVNQVSEEIKLFLDNSINK